MRVLFKWIESHAVMVLCIVIIILLALSALTINQMFGQTLDAIDSQSIHLGNVIYTQIRNELDTVLSSASELVSMMSSNILVHQFSSIEAPLTSENHYNLYELLRSIAPYRNIVYNNKLILDFAIYYPQSDILINMQSVYKPKHYFDTWYQDSKISYEDWHTLITGKNTGCFVPSAYTDEVMLYIQSMDISQRPAANFLVFFSQEEFEKMISELEQPNYRVVLAVDDINTVSSSLPEDLEVELKAHQAGISSQKSSWTISELPSNTFHNAIYYICEKTEDNSLIPQKRLQQFYNVAITLLFIIVIGTLFITLLVAIFPTFKKLRQQKGNLEKSPMQIMKNAIDIVLSRKQSESGTDDWLIVKDALLDLLTNTEEYRGNSLVTLSEHNIVFVNPYFLITIFFISTPVNESYLHQLTAICNEKYRDDIICACFSISRERFAALFNLNQADTPYIDIIETIRTELSKKTDSTVFVGSIQEGTSNIHQSYKDAAALFEYEIFTGSNTILDHNAYLHNDEEFFYPMDVELSLISAVSNGNSQRVLQILKEIHDENFYKRQLRPDIAKLLLNELTGTTLKVTKNVNFSISQYPITEITKCTTVEEVFYTLQDFYLKICEKQHEMSGIIRKEQFKQYIELHYTEPDFSQGNMADHFNVSQNYLSSQFKACFGVTMISYVNTLRAEKAATLLKNTDVSVQEIAAECGFSSGDSLARVFKKKYGVTPSDFRNGI